MRYHELTIVPVSPATPEMGMPTFVVECLNCTFRHDSYGADEATAVQMVAGAHDPTHTLRAVPVDYSERPEYRSRP